MNNFSYITGYLPNVTTRETQLKKAQKIRLIYTAGISILFIIFLAIIIINSTSEQVLSKKSKITSFSNLIDNPVPKKKPIWLLIDPSRSNPFLLTSKLEVTKRDSKEKINIITVNKNIYTSNTSLQKLETLYQEELDRLFNRAFANTK